MSKSSSMMIKTSDARGAEAVEEDESLAIVASAKQQESEAAGVNPAQDEPELEEYEYYGE